jgi:hypothetical protein
MFEKCVISTDIGMGSKCATLLYDLFLYLVFVSIILHPKACYEKRKQANPVLLIFVPIKTISAFDNVSFINVFVRIRVNLFNKNKTFYIFHDQQAVCTCIYGDHFFF